MRDAVAELREETVAVRDRELSVLRPADADALLDEEAFEREERLPYWAELWPSGVALARLLSVRSLRGARVLELGSGLGLPNGGLTVIEEALLPRGAVYSLRRRS